MATAGRVAPALFASAVVLTAGCGAQPRARTGPDVGRGKETFVTSRCGTCHTLDAAGTKGTVGPGLDHLRLSRARVARYVRAGGADMPAYAKTLSPVEIADLAAFVSDASRR